MIRDLDRMLRFLFVSQVPELTGDNQVSFWPPDDDWRTEVLNLNEVGLNIYLVDLRENRKLRSNAQVRTGVVNGQVMYQAAPTRVECHYLITAWSPAQAGPATTPTLDEHHLLYQVMAVLNNQPLNPVQIYADQPATLAALPDLFKTDLPTQVLPMEGFLKQAEFWGTMGANQRWRPAIYLIVTLPLALMLPPAGPEVTTPLARLGRTAFDRDVLRGETDTFYMIGGQVSDATGPEPKPVASAWVRLVSAGGEPLKSTRTDEAGHFIFERLPAGSYQLEWRAEGFAVPAPQPVIVPAPSGSYDLQFV